MDKNLPKQSAALMSLKIPHGWAITHNTFYDVEPRTDGNSFIVNLHEGFTLDVLSICECRLNADKGYYIPERETWRIDMGWTQDGYIEGEYYAQLLWDGTEQPHTIEDISSKNRFEIRDRIEHWMMTIHLNYSQCQKKMKTEYR